MSDPATRDSGGVQQFTFNIDGVPDLNPALDVRNQTAELAVDLIESLFGKSTLMRE